MNKIIITRPEGKDSETISIANKYGFSPIIINAVKIVKLDYEIDPEDFSVVVFLSETAARFFLKKYKIENKKIACIGPKTKEFLEKHGYNVNLIPDKFDSKTLGYFLLKNLEPKDRVLVVRSKKGTTDLLKILKEKFYVNEIYVYDLVEPDEEEIRKFERNLKDCIGVIFTSSQSVINIMKYIKKEYEKELRKKIIISIGPTTHRTLLKYNIISIYPENYTLEDCFKLLKQCL